MFKELDIMLNSMGLFLDIAGAVLIFIYGIPQRVKNNEMNLGLAGEPFILSKKEKKQIGISKFGIILLLTVIYNFLMLPDTLKRRSEVSPLIYVTLRHRYIGSALVGMRATSSRLLPEVDRKSRHIQYFPKYPAHEQIVDPAQ